jgi:hypothetical protein
MMLQGLAAGVATGSCLPGIALAAETKEDKRPVCRLEETSGDWSLWANTEEARIESAAGEARFRVSQTDDSFHLSVTMPHPADNHSLVRLVQQYSEIRAVRAMHLLFYADGKLVAAPTVPFSNLESVYRQGVLFERVTPGYRVTFDLRKTGQAVIREILKLLSVIPGSRKVQVMAVFRHAETFGNEPVRYARADFRVSEYSFATGFSVDLRNQVREMYKREECRLGKKIVCTAMNEAYGFGEFRNTIWLRHSRDHMKPEHEAGYHFLCLPIVRYAYGGQGRCRLLVRKGAEHIARARTRDIWCEMRTGRRYLPGRAWRAVLEPLFLVTGHLLFRLRSAPVQAPSDKITSGDRS